MQTPWEKSGSSPQLPFCWFKSQLDGSCGGTILRASIHVPSWLHHAGGNWIGGIMQPVWKEPGARNVSRTGCNPAGLKYQVDSSCEGTFGGHTGVVEQSSIPDKCYGGISFFLGRDKEEAATFHQIMGSSENLPRGGSFPSLGAL